VDDLTQLERRMIEVARLSNSPDKSRRWWPLKSDKARAADHVARLLAESGYGQERVVVSSILRAMRYWLRAPREVRRVYRNKAARMLWRGEFKQALLRTQKWSASSKWSKGDGLNAHPRRRNWGISALRRWLMRLGRSSPVRRD
jgi:KaiC/GvpD/RAD55 family RecA-like ATPase